MARVQHLLFVLSLSWCLAAALGLEHLGYLKKDWEGYSCDSIKDIPEALRCQFVTEECQSDSRLPYTEWYYCSVAPQGVFARGAFVALLACVLPLLFCLLGNTAELYFSPTMSLVSQTIPKMRPRFAGVTFVAMGNGAPDLSANISAIRSGQVALSAGAFTGAAMFVQCVVASEVIRISQGVTCKGAVLRDVGTYAVSITGVGLCFYSGEITHWFVIGAVLVYVAYASWVFAGDEWHAAGRPALQPDRMTWDDLRALLLQRQYGRGRGGGGGGARAGGSALPGPQDPQAQLSEALLPWATLDSEQEQQEAPTQAGQVKVMRDGAAVDGLRGCGAGDVEEGQGDEERGGSFGNGGAPLPHLDASMRAPWQQHKAGSDRSSTANAQRYLDARTYKQAVWADLEDEPVFEQLRELEEQQQLRRQLRRRQQHQAVELQSSTEGGGAGRGGRFYTPEPSHSRKYQPPSLADSSSQGSSRLSGRASTGSMRVSNGQPAADMGGVQVPGGSLAAVPSPFRHVPEGGGAAVGASAGSGGAGEHAEPQPGPSPDLGASGSVEGGVIRVQGSGSAELAPFASTDLDWSLGGIGEEGEGRREMQGARKQQQQQQHAQIKARQQVDWKARLWEQIKSELTLGESAEWHELPGWRRTLREVSFRCLLPAHAAQRATIPQVDPASYSQQWLVVSMLCSPLAVLVYFDAYNLGAVLVAMGVGSTLALVAHILTKDEEELPTLDLGTSFAFGPAILSLAGFFMGVLWIDTLASEVVGIVSLVSRLLGLPPSLVGLTLLAVGSSLGDFFGNPSMARRGHSSTALTACFAGPLFNMLISMAAGFGSFFAKEGITRTPVQFTPDIALGVICLVIYNAVVAAVGLLNHSRIPERFYLFARAWYGIYIVLACVLGLKGL